MTEAAPGLVLRGVGAGYGDGLVLQDVDLDIPPGTLVGVIGPNGSGKSTLLKAILGLAPMTTGTVLLDGRPVAEQRHRLAYVPQREAVDWSFPVSAEQVVMMGRYPRVGWLRIPGGATVPPCATPSSGWRWPTSPPRRSAPCRAGSSSASSWRGPWCRRHRSCCWMNR